jgi:hypothetical protein
MKKLDDIPKKEVFKVPEGYFENLPSIIQSRLAGQKKEKTFFPGFSLALRYAMPVVLLGVIAYIWLGPKAEQKSAESILATIETKDLVAYLNETDLTTEELLEAVQLDVSDLDEIEGEIYGEDLTDQNFEEILDDI